MTTKTEGWLIPAGHACPDDASPLIKLLMRNLAAACIGSGDANLGAIIREAGGGVDRRGDLYGLAKYVIESLPSEVTILRGGCGGENVAACYTLEGADEAFQRVVEVFGGEVPIPGDWPIVERIPLVKR